MADRPWIYAEYFLPARYNCMQLDDVRIVEDKELSMCELIFSSTVPSESSVRFSVDTFHKERRYPAKLC